MMRYEIKQLYDKLKSELSTLLRDHDIADRQIIINCKALSSEEAIGNPEHQDYPIVKGRERMIEAEIMGAKGQAFTDEYSKRVISAEDLLTMPLDSNRSRAQFIAAYNALFRYLGLVEKTIHCRNEELILCGKELLHLLPVDAKILLIGLQPRFLEALAERQPVRVVDLDEENVGKEKFGIKVEAEESTEDAIQWCDIIFATGSTIVNGSISRFLASGKRAIFYGVTIVAPAKVLDLEVYCPLGH